MTVNQTSPPEYPAQPGAGTPVDAVALALVAFTKLQVVPTFNGVALQGSSFEGGGNTATSLEFIILSNLGIANA